jgi:hypothetical protein
MPTYTFDSSVIIAYRVRELPKNFVLSAVVIAELAAGATDDSIRKVYEAMRLEFLHDNALIIPTADDWLTASRILYWLSQGRKKKPVARQPSSSPGQASGCFLMR